MYDAFSSSSSNDDAFSVIEPTWDRNEKNPAGTAAARMSHGINLNFPDQIPQRLLDRIVWKTVHGDRLRAASARAERELRRIVVRPATG